MDADGHRLKKSFEPSFHEPLEMPPGLAPAERSGDGAFDVKQGVKPLAQSVRSQLKQRQRRCGQCPARVRMWIGHNRVAVDAIDMMLTQGSSFLATLG